MPGCLENLCRNTEPESPGQIPFYAPTPVGPKIDLGSIPDPMGNEMKVSEIQTKADLARAAKIAFIKTGFQPFRRLVENLEGPQPMEFSVGFAKLRSVAEMYANTRPRG